MSPQNTHERTPPLDQRWQELCAAIRASDDTSFKLLALVPLVSVAGIAASLLKVEPKVSFLVALLGLFAASFTLGLWVWERRNIQRCLWLRQRAAEMEARIYGDSVAGAFFAFPKGPGGWGKTEAEMLVYGLTIAAWLVLPVAVFASDSTAKCSMALLIPASIYVAVSASIGYLAWRELWRSIDCTPDFTQGRA